VEDGQADLALTLPPMVEGPFEVRQILAEPYLFLMCRAQPVRRIEELDGKRLLRTGCRSGALIDQRLLAEGITPVAIDRIDNVGLIQALVAAGEGIAIVPGLSVDRQERDRSVAVLPAAEVQPRQLVSLTRRDRPRAGPLDRLMQLVHDACVSLAASELAFVSPRH
jgi:DNA-binding transcriptional LysR family regulator